MIRALADYERRSTRAADAAALMAGLVMLVILLWVGFEKLAPTGWWNDGTFTADLAWIAAYWTGSFAILNESGVSPIPGHDQALAALGAAQAVLASFDLVRPVLTRLVAACLGS